MNANSFSANTFRSSSLFIQSTLNVDSLQPAAVYYDNDRQQTGSYGISGAAVSGLTASSVVFAFQRKNAMPDAKWIGVTGSASQQLFVFARYASASFSSVYVSGPITIVPNIDSLPPANCPATSVSLSDARL